VRICAGQERLLSPGDRRVSGALTQTLRTCTHAALDNIVRDVQAASAHSEAFLACVRHPDLLPRHDALDAGGLVHVDPRDRVLIYDLDARGLARRSLPASELSRWMLGARATHEWCHLAVSAGWMGAGVEGDPSAVARLAPRFDELCQRARSRAELAPELARLGAEPGVALARVALARAPDFASNQLAARLLGDSELQTYVRNNVAGRLGELPPGSLLTALARASFEIRYLELIGIRDPVAWYAESSWFDELYAAPGLASRELLADLSLAVGEELASYSPDPNQLVLPAS
jgi:hypothetical protein